MKRLRSLWVCANIAVVLSCGCSTVNSEIFTKGAIQAGREIGVSDAPVKGPRNLGTVKVTRFTESRRRNQREEHNLWMAYIPIACVATYWDRPDWLVWGSDQGAYKPVGLDMAEAISGELADTGLFEKVLGPKDEGAADWVVSGDIQSLRLMLRPHLCGGSVILAPFIGATGVPMGNWSVEQRLVVEVKRVSDGRSMGEKLFNTQASGMMAAYFGNNPLQFGYPYVDMMSPVVAGLVSALPEMVAEARKHPPVVAEKAVAVAAVEPQQPSVLEVIVPVVKARKETDDVKQAAGRGVNWAVVVGVSAYRDTRIPALRYAADDARAFYQWLVSAQGGRHAPANVKVLLDGEATAVNIRQALFDWLQQAVAEDQVTIYFAGHGSPDSPDSTANLFLLPHDADYAHISATAFPMWDVETALKRYIKAKRVVVIADACHSAGVGEGFDVARRAGRGMTVNPIDSGLENLANTGEGTCVISASSGSQTSQEGAQWGGGHGVFTYFLLQGLSGKADYPQDGKITLGKLTQYVSEQVRRATRSQQTPIVSGRYDPAWTLGR